MIRSGFVLFGLLLILAACAPAPALPPTLGPTASAIPAAVLPSSTPTLEATATTPSGAGDLFTRISRSTNVLHQKCDPLEIIFDVTVASADVKGVLFFFRMKDKATGLVNSWSNGENMRPAGNGMFEFIFRASAIPDEARYKDAWVQYQFVGVDRNLRSIGHSQIFGNELTFTPGCP